MTTSPELIVEKDGGVLSVTFNRPERRNALTRGMYDGLEAACEAAGEDPEVRVLVLRGAGDQAFSAGTDIGLFAELPDGQAGVEYETRMTAMLDRLAEVPVPVVAAIRGYCAGAGLAIAAACDLRVAGRSAKFGIPIARTLGNCLSMSAYALLVEHFGTGRTLDLLLRARFLDAEEAAAAGFVTELCADEDLDAAVQALAARLAGHAPLSMWAAKEAVRRLRSASLPDGSDIIHRVYGSRDFRHGVDSFLAKRPPEWSGR